MAIENDLYCRECPKTIILDIDGTLLEHDATAQGGIRVLPGVHERLAYWSRKGYHIIILTGRRESRREETINQLKMAKIYYDMLIMGVGPGFRYLINDYKPDSDEPTAVGVTIKRNAGLEGVDIP